MREILLSLDRDALPVQYGVSGGSLLERFFEHAVGLIAAGGLEDDPAEGAVSLACDPTTPITNNFTTEDGILFRYHPAVVAKQPEKDTRWVAERTQDSASSTDWLEVVQVDTHGEQRAAVLRICTNGRTDFFVATSSEMFMTTILLSQTPG